MFCHDKKLKEPKYKLGEKVYNAIKYRCVTEGVIKSLKYKDEDYEYVVENIYEEKNDYVDAGGRITLGKSTGKMKVGLIHIKEGDLFARN